MEFYKAQIVEILNKSFSSHQKDKDLYTHQLVTYAHAYPNFTLLSFVAHFLDMT
jgi:hypothetical protein